MSLIGKKLILCCIGLSCVIMLKAQQMPIYSQYGMYNPAVAGADGFTTFNLTSRDEWIGFDNSPKTNVISVQGRILRSNSKVKNSQIGRAHV